MGKFKVRPDGEQFDEIYDEALKETASEDKPEIAAFNRAEREYFKRLEMHGITSDLPYSNYHSYRKCRNNRLRKRNVREKRDKSSSG